MWWRVLREAGHPCTNHDKWVQTIGAHPCCVARASHCLRHQVAGFKEPGPRPHLLRLVWRREPVMLRSVCARWHFDERGFTQQLRSRWWHDGWSVLLPNIQHRELVVCCCTNACVGFCRRQWLRSLFILCVCIYNSFIFSRDKCTYLTLMYTCNCIVCSIQCTLQIQYTVLF